MGRCIKKGLCGAVGERCCSARARARPRRPGLMWNRFMWTGPDGLLSLRDLPDLVPEGLNARSQASRGLELCVERSVPEGTV
jgi:hypothetical protein